MPKDISERIIDSPFAPVTRVGNVSIGTGGGGGGGGATNLDALTDVTLSGVANGQTLSYNSGTGQWVNAAPAAMVAHALSGSFHTGTLLWSKVDTAGSNLTDITTRLHSDLQGMTPNDHHFQAHVLATGTALGADHTISGAAVGEVLRALSATTAAFDVLQHTDLGNILPDQHHTRVHDIISGDLSGPVHTVVGADYTVVGVHPANTLAILPTSNAPGAAISVLRTDANGGIQLDTNLLYVDGANNWIGVNRTPSGATLDLIAAANADHTQRIKMKSGQTARLWRIEDLSGNELIVLDSVGNLQSGRPGFVSGLTGWQITPEGNAEFNNIWARGELHATVFVKDEVHATGGSFMVATAGVLHDDAQIDASTVDEDVLIVYSTPAGQGVPLQVVTTSGTFAGNELHVIGIRNVININDPPSGPGFYFQPGDIVRSKTEVPTGVTDFWLEVNGATQNSGYSSYSVFKRSGTDGTLPKGAAVVSYGKQGDGRILMTSDLNYAPYIDVFTTGVNVWTGAAGSVIPRMRMGRLDGIGLPGISGVEQYGMIAGKDLSDANSGYLIASNLQFSLYKVDIRLNNGSNDTGLWTADGNLRIGSNIGADATTGFRVYTTSGGGHNPGDVVIGNESTGNYLRWNQSGGTLQVVGSLVVSDPGTTVTLKYVDDQDKYYDGLANLTTGYAGAAQTNSQNYGDARRIVGVTGSWASAPNVISWGAPTAVAVVFANGGSRTITAGNTGTMAARTYLYVNMSGSGTMTMVATTSAGAIAGSANNVLIAVCDPGAVKASVSIVAGSTYISGGNIFAESITAGDIAAGTITADRLDASTLTVTYLDPIQTSANNAQTSANTAQSTANSANTAAGTAQSTANTANTAAGAAQTSANTANTAAGNAQTTANSANSAAAAAQADADAAALATANNKTYGDQRRMINVSGTWTVVNGNTISWASLQANFASGGPRTITAQSNVALGSPTTPGRWYLYVDVGSGSGTMAMQTPTQTLSTLGVNDVLIAVVDTSTAGPTPKASINVVAGSTYISGGNIMTGSIVAANIAVTTITADKMNIDRLDGMKLGTIYTGILELDETSNIHAGKTTFGSTTNGFFLGYDSTAYKFKVGNNNTNLTWDGANLFVLTNQSFNIRNTNTGQMLLFDGLSGAQALLSLPANAILTSSAWFTAPQVLANKLVNTGNTFQVGTPRTIVHSNTMPESLGVIGEICWDTNYLYVCHATNQWRRIRLDPLDTW